MKIEFEERAVAFIDVLGFSSLVVSAASNPKALAELQTLINTLSSAVPYLDQGVSKTVPAHLIPEHTYISDSIILSAPLADAAMKNYNGLSIVVMRCIQLTHHFLKRGYLLRGGISTGKVWHNESNIVGPAYQEAYELEHTGCNPCVVLSESAKALWQGYGSRMCVVHEETIMVNGLHDYYIQENTSSSVIEKTFDEYRELATLRINSQLPEKAKAKWRWFNDYLAAERSEAMKWAAVY